MGSGDPPGLQNRRAAGHPVAGAFDSHTLPPSSLIQVLLIELWTFLEVVVCSQFLVEKGEISAQKAVGVVVVLLANGRIIVFWAMQDGDCLLRQRMNNE
jgi:hypothetical protein